MFVKVAFVIGRERLLTVPRQAVVYRSEVTGVYVIDDQGRVRLRHVRTGRPTGDDNVAVLSGLSEGERVALDPVAAGARLKQQERSGD